jgi:hypothetical protein
MDGVQSALQGVFTENTGKKPKNNETVGHMDKSDSGPPISSDTLYAMADWIASRYEGRRPTTKKVLEPHQLNSATPKSTPAIPEYDDNKIYAQGDRVRFMNRIWYVKDAVGQPGYKPPTEPNVTSNNTWLLVGEGGRRKTVRRGKKHSRRR